MVLVDDLTQLPDLDEPNMLNSLCCRYLQQQPKIYTRTGPILVGMNPWQDLKLYTPEVCLCPSRCEYVRLILKGNGSWVCAS